MESNPFDQFDAKGGENPFDAFDQKPAAAEQPPANRGEWKQWFEKHPDQKPNTPEGWDKWLTEYDKPDASNPLVAIGQAGQRIHDKIAAIPEDVAIGVIEGGVKAGWNPKLTAGLATFDKMALESIPGMLTGGSVAKGVGAATSGIAQRGAEAAMQSALKPVWAKARSGEAATAIRTMLDEGLTVTPQGVRQLRGKIDQLNAEIKDIIAKSPATINKSAVAARLESRLKAVKDQVNPQSDVATIKKTLQNFMEHPELTEELAPGIKVSAEEIPIQQAQKMKQATYKQLGDRGYNPAQTAEQAESIQSQKALARGLKEEIAKAEPSLRPLNAKESELIKTMGVAERRVLMDANKNPGGLGWLTLNPAKFAAFMLDRSPAFKSYVAIKLQQYARSQSIGAAGAATGALGQQALGGGDQISPR